MREYYLQDVEYRKTVDLTQYTNLITNSIHKISPKVTVNVYKDKYTIDPDPPKGELIKIGRSLAGTQQLGQFCIIRPLLFKGEKVKETTKDDELKEKDTNKQDNKDKPKKKGRCR